MNVKHVGNQDNRINFNGRVQFKSYSPKIETNNVQLDLAMLEEIGEKLAQIRDFSKGLRANQTTARRELHMGRGKQHITFWYDLDGGLGVINQKQAFLQPYSWEDNFTQSTDTNYQTKFREVKVKLAQLISKLLDR